MLKGDAVCDLDVRYKDFNVNLTNRVKSIRIFVYIVLLYTYIVLLLLYYIVFVL